MLIGGTILLLCKKETSFVELFEDKQTEHNIQRKMGQRSKTK